MTREITEGMPKKELDIEQEFEEVIKKTCFTENIRGELNQKDVLTKITCELLHSDILIINQVYDRCADITLTEICKNLEKEYSERTIRSRVDVLSDLGLIQKITNGITIVSPVYEINDIIIKMNGIWHIINKVQKKTQGRPQKLLPRFYILEYMRTEGKNKLVTATKIIKLMEKAGYKEKFSVKKIAESLEEIHAEGKLKKISGNKELNPKRRIWLYSLNVE